MKILKYEKFTKGWGLTEFVSKNNIAREDIIAIVASGEYWFTLFYYGEE